MPVESGTLHRWILSTAAGPRFSCPIDRPNTRTYRLCIRACKAALQYGPPRFGHKPARGDPAVQRRPCARELCVVAFLSGFGAARLPFPTLKPRFSTLAGGLRPMRPFALLPTHTQQRSTPFLPPNNQRAKSSCCLAALLWAGRVLPLSFLTTTRPRPRTQPISAIGLRIFPHIDAPLMAKKKPSLA